MNLRNKLVSLGSIIKTKFFLQRVPLIISWHLLDRCNRKCKYCNWWSMSSKELTTQEVFSIIGEMAKMRTQAIIFSGGEPLLREDIGQIIKYCHSKNIFAGLTSNGSLVPSKINEIRNLDLIKLSFDGPLEIHDLIRGEGSYNELMNAVKVAKENALKIALNTTLTKYNLDSIDFILGKAEELDIKVKFQVVNYVHAPGRDISFLFPEKRKYKDAVKKLIDLKRHNKYIINSFTALNYLYNWPHNIKLACYAGRLICCISSNGNLYPCTMMINKINTLNCLKSSFKEAFHSLPIKPLCNGCWCTSTLELNCLLDLNFDTILNIKKLFK